MKSWQIIALRIPLGDNRPARAESKELLQIAITYREAAKLLKVKSAAQGGSSEVEPTHLDVMSELAQNPPSPHLYDAMLAVYAEPGENWLNVHHRIAANQRLWKFEDQNVPKALQIRYSWVENGVLKGPYSETVSIVLPTSLAARFKPSI